jgi:hypothetical protein
VNLNCGAESILAFQLAHYAMAAIARRPLATGAVQEPNARDTIAMKINSKGTQQLAGA